MCLCDDLFQIQSVHLRRITGPDGHWLNNTTPAEGHSVIKFSLKKTKTIKSNKNKIFISNNELGKEISLIVDWVKYAVYLRSSFTMM